MNLHRSTLAAIVTLGTTTAAIMLQSAIKYSVVDEAMHNSSGELPIVQPAREHLAAAKQESPTLIHVSISPEARVKATAIPGRRDLRQGEWSEFTIMIDNAAGITAPLFVESDQQMTSDTDTTRDHWLQLELVTTGELTGAPTEFRTLRLQSRDSGIRSMVVNINAGQGTQDLAFRSDVTLSFNVTPHIRSSSMNSID